MTTNILFLSDLDHAALRNIYTSDLFLDKVSNPNYSRLFQEYNLDYYKNSDWTNVSIALECGGEVKALVIIYTDNNGQASFFHQPALIVLPDNTTEALSIEINHMLDTLFNKLKALNVTNVLLNTKEPIESYVSQLEIVETKLAYVDLDLPLAEIKRSVRKSYKSLINWGLKNYDIRVIDKNNPDKQQFQLLMKFHRDVAGKITRSDASWEVQYEMICAGEAFALQAYYQDQLVSASLITHSQAEAWYGVGVYDRALMAEGLPLAHGLLFKAIEICKNANINTFILGDVSTLNSKKEESIVKFKSGFTKSILNQTVISCRI